MGKAFESIKTGLTEAMADTVNPRDSVQPVTPAPPRIVACPKCGMDVEWIAENRHRPFCSARCKGVDFVAWATDSYRIEAPDEPHPEDQSE